MNFVKLFIGDYLRDTGALTLAQHGAYMLMLLECYATEKPLPEGRDLHRLLRAETKAERDAIDFVAGKFWKNTVDGLVNPRAIKEIERAAHQRDVNRAVGKLGGRPKRTESQTESVTESVTESDSEQIPNRNPSHSHSNTIPSFAIAQDGSAAAPPGGSLPSPMTAKERIWQLGPPLLGESPASRSLLGRLARDHGESVLAEVLADATLQQPIEPKAWVMAACITRSKPKPNNGHDIRAAANNPLGDEETCPQWCADAGYSNRWVAENDGCTARTAHKFREGRRVAS